MMIDDQWFFFFSITFCMFALFQSGEKVLVLKKKFRTGSIPASNLSKSSTDLARAQSEPPNQPPSPQVPRAREKETDAMTRVKSEGNLGDASSGSNPSVETVSASSVSTADSSVNPCLLEPAAQKCSKSQARLNLILQPFQQWIFWNILRKQRSAKIKFVRFYELASDNRK